MARNININLEGKDNVSPALKSASARLVELRSEIEQLRAKGKIDITVADTRNFAKLTNEANKLEKQLDAIGTTGVKGANSLRSAFSGLDKVLGQIGLGGFAGALTGAGFAAAAVQIGKVAVELGNLGAQSIVTRDSFESVMASVGKSPALLNELSSAAGGTITQMRLMQLANTAVAGASEELGGAFAEALPKLIEGARAANQLNPALGDTEFLFNSLVTGIKRGSPMLIDNTGITLKLGDANEAFAKSLGKSVNELTEEEKKLAILQGTLDGVDRLVQQAGGNLDNLTTSTQQLTTAWQDLRTAIGEGLAPMVSQTQAGMADALSRITAAIQAGSVDSEIALQGLNSQLQIAKNELAQLEAQPFDPNDEFGTSAARADILRQRIAELEAQTYSAGGAELDMAEKLRISRDAAREAAGAMRELNAARGGTDWNAKARSLALVGRYEGITGAESAKQEEYARAMGLLRSRQTRLNLETEANAEIADDYVRSMRSAVSTVASEVESAFSAAQSASKGLFDFTGGAGDMFKPGSNGPFEAIYRAQAVAVGGIETDQERQWAEMYGLTPESAARIVADFQRGLFSPEVQGLINVDQLVGQIQSEQAASESKTAFANMIAGKLGVADAGALVASQTFQAISGGIEADPTQQADAAQRVLDAYLNNVNAVVTGKDYAGRMIAFGTTTWVYYEQGLLEGAKESAVFARAVDAAIGAWMARQAAPKSQGVVGAAAAMGVTP
jgi:hypothetical protein